MKDDRLYLIHTIECIERIQRFVGGGKESFLGSDLIQAGVLRTLQVMAESTQRLCPSIKERSPEMAWRKISGLRNVLVHDYFDIDLDLIWNIIKIDLPGLKSFVESVLQELGGP